MDWSQVVSFALIAIVMEISPGPNFALITKSVSSGGSAAAFANIPGFATAFLMHGTLSIFGVAALLAASPSLLIVMQLVGAIYLLYLGIQSFTPQEYLVVAVESGLGTCNLEHCAESDGPFTVETSPSVFKGFADGLVTNCLNPKISLFYYAVFPQITASSDKVVLTSFLLIVIHIVANAVWFFMVAIALGRMLRSAGSEKFVQILRKGSGIVLIGFWMFFAAGVAQAI